MWLTKEFEKTTNKFLVKSQEFKTEEDKSGWDVSNMKTEAVWWGSIRQYSPDQSESLIPEIGNQWISRRPD